MKYFLYHTFCILSSFLSHSPPSQTLRFIFWQDQWNIRYLAVDGLCFVVSVALLFLIHSPFCAKQRNLHSYKTNRFKGRHYTHVSISYSPPEWETKMNISKLEPPVGVITAIVLFCVWIGHDESHRSWTGKQLQLVNEMQRGEELVGCRNRLITAE